MNKILILLCVLITACTSSNQSVEPEDKSFSFFVAGHVYGGPGAQNNPFHPPFMNYLDAAKKEVFDLAVFTGDIVQESGEKTWDKVDSTIEITEYPIYFAAGNHDLKYREFYEKRYGETNYSFEKGNNLFVVWDVLNSGWNVNQEKIDALNDQISENQYKNVFIFSHHVFWYDSLITPEIKPNSLYARLPNQTFYGDVIHQLNTLKIPLYIFGGDVGARTNESPLALHQYKNVKLICSGMGGMFYDNVIEVEIKSDIVHLQVKYLDGHQTMNLDTIFKQIEL